jgi:DNA invertase Pin-like site-specific DNA recombinase
MSKHQPRDRFAFILARVSTREQADGFSNQTQVDACRAYADEKGLIVIDVREDVETGYTLERDGLTEFMERLERGEARHLIVYQLDRLSRDFYQSLAVRGELRLMGVLLHLAQRNTIAGETIDALAIDNLEAILADAEGRRDKERSARGRIGKAKAQKLIGNGTPPFGYRQIGHGRDVEYYIYEPEAVIIVLIFIWYVFGAGDGHPLSVVKIALKLQEMQIPTPRDRNLSKTGSKANKKRAHAEWSPSTIYDMLEQEAYIGTFYHNKVHQAKGMGFGLKDRSEWIGLPIPAIIPMELWNAAQEKRKRSKPAPRAGYEYLLTGQISCLCGYRRAGGFSICYNKSNVRGYKYYTCNSRHEMTAGKPCSSPPLPGPQVDNLVWEWVLSTLINPVDVERVLRDRQQCQQSEKRRVLRQIQVLQDEERDRQHKLAMILELHLEGRLSKDLLMEREISLKRELESIKNGLDELQKQATISLTDDGIMALLDFSRALSSGNVTDDFQTRRRIVELLDLHVSAAAENKVMVIRATSLLSQHEFLVPVESNRGILLPGRRRRSERNREEGNGDQGS